MKFKVFRGSDHKFYFHVRSSNGKITLPSQSYPSAAHAHRAVLQVWKGFAKAMDISFAFAPAVPYTRDSLPPPARRKKD